MIVTCKKCSTQFKLDDARVPDQGVKVRCSRCKHAFQVARPATGEQRVERAVEHALDADTQELDGDDTRPGSEHSPFDDSFDDSVEESDWEFNTDKSADRPEPRPEPAPDSLRGESESIEYALGDAPAAGESLAGPEEPEAAPELASPPPAASVAAAELGSPEDWNFFPDEASQAPPAKTAPVARVAIGKIGVASSVGPAAAPFERDGKPSWLGLWLGRGFAATGWLVVGGLLLALAARGVALSMPATEVGPSVQSLGSLEARDVEARWLENAVAGPILVVSGELAGSARSPSDRWIAVRLLDRRGAVVDEDAGAVGPALSTLELREADPRQLRAAQVSAALGTTRVAPGARRRFHAVLHPVPVEAVRFELVAVPAGERRPGAEPSGAPSQPAG